MKQKIIPLRQLTRTECGLCCVAMICQYYGYRKPMSYFRKLLDVGRDGTNIKSIVSALEKLKIKTNIFKYSPSLFEIIQNPILVILDNNHFVVVEKNKGKHKLVINDPAIGKIVISKSEFEQRIGSYIIITEKSHGFQKSNDSILEWKPLFNILSTARYKLLLTIFLSTITYSYVLFLPLVIQHFIDLLIQKGSLNFTEDIFFIGLFIIIIFTASNITKNLIAVNFEATLDKSFLFEVIEKLVRLPYKFFESRTNGDLLFRLNLLNSIRTFISDVIVASILDISGIFFAIIYALAISSKLFVILCVVLFVMCLVTNSINSKIVELNHYELTEITEITIAESELVNSIYEIKALGIEQLFVSKIEKSHQKFSSQFKRRNLWTKNYNSLLLFFQLFFPFLLLIFNIANINKLNLSIGKIIAFYSVSSILLSNTISLIQKWTNLKLMKNSLIRINDIFLEDNDDCGNKEIKSFEKLNVSNLGFSYSEIANNVLDNINIKVMKGMKVAIVGISGSGKSTLVKLLLGLYKPSSGTIYYNDIMLNQLNKKSLHQLVSVITQDAALFNKSLKDNIILNRDDITKEELYSVLKQVGMLDAVMQMPMREETLISEFGNNISGGQRQRLAMARSIVNQPELLIMDEATSSLDGISEIEISNYLSGFNCAQIIISHRLSTIMSADYIYVMNNGSIVEEGILEDLVLSGTIFNNIFDSQISSKIAINK